MERTMDMMDVLDDMRSDVVALRAVAAMPGMQAGAASILGAIINSMESRLKEAEAIVKA